MCTHKHAATKHGSRRDAYNLRKAAIVSCTLQPKFCNLARASCSSQPITSTTRLMLASSARRTPSCAYWDVRFVGSGALPKMVSHKDVVSSGPRCCLAEGGWSKRAGRGRAGEHADLQQLATAAAADYNMKNLEKDSNLRQAVVAKPMGQQQLTKAICNGPSAAEWAQLIMPLK